MTVLILIIGLLLTFGQLYLIVWLAERLRSYELAWGLLIGAWVVIITILFIIHHTTSQNKHPKR